MKSHKSLLVVELIWHFAMFLSSSNSEGVNILAIRRSLGSRINSILLLNYDQQRLKIQGKTPIMHKKKAYLGTTHIRKVLITSLLVDNKIFLSTSPIAAIDMIDDAS